MLFFILSFQDKLLTKLDEKDEPERAMCEEEEVSGILSTPSLLT